MTEIKPQLIKMEVDYIAKTKHPSNPMYFMAIDTIIFIEKLGKRKTKYKLILRNSMN